MAQRLIQSNASLQFQGIGMEAVGPKMGGLQFEVLRGQALRDHYDPTTNTLRLSEGVAYGKSVASMAIVAHELGHAQQHEQASALMAMRSFLVPAVQFSPQVAYILRLWPKITFLFLMCR